MVVSKDSKRKRKEQSPPATPQQQSSSATTAATNAAAALVESSPEMPKRTKVQAQRKFAQGQSAPQSSYSSILAAAASSSTNTGPSTSSETREPPTEILPNKRPKTEDFLTFLCFRGTSALPAHLDYLNQGKSKEPERPVKKVPIKTPTKKKGKKGRPPKIKPNEEETVVQENNAKNTQEIAEKSTQEESKTDAKIESKNLVNSPESTKTNSKKIEKDSEKPSVDDVPITFPVRKRAEVVAEGNRRSNRAADDKANSSAEIGKRRSNRASTKESKVMLDHLSDDDDDEDEYYSAIEEGSKGGGGAGAAASQQNNSDIEPQKDRSKSNKTPNLKNERKSETPSKESETTTKSRPKGRPSSTNKKTDNEIKDCDQLSTRTEKAAAVAAAPTKRPRQRESPIFIPSPEPSGRMTRQRAFFEPVKVPTRANENDNLEELPPNSINNQTNNDGSNDLDKKCEETAIEINSIKPADDIDNKNLNVKAAEKLAAETKPEPTNHEDKEKTKTNLNVFDFSSDDEQPLAKTIKIKKSGTSKQSPKKSNVRAKKSLTKTDLPTLTIPITTISPKEESKVTVKQEDKNIVKEQPVADTEPAAAAAKSSKGKRSAGKNKKQADNEETPNESDKELSPPSPKKTANSKQSRKKASNAADAASENNTLDSGSPQRNQRPSRKTKEAATIYMGIIGQRLQMDEDEDDISLNSFERPNVREMEKMENELRRGANAAAAAGSPTKSTSALETTPPKQIKSKQERTPPPPVAVPEKPATTGRRGRPPKNPKPQPPPPPPVKREIEGMLVKKGVIAKLTQSTENLLENKDKIELQTNKAEDDEDFLLNEELNETKRKLERSFSDSDDEPLAIKAHVVKSDDKPDNAEDAGAKSTDQNDIVAPPCNLPITTAPQTTAQNIPTFSTLLPLTTRPVVPATTPQQLQQSSPPILAAIFPTTTTTTAAAALSTPNAAVTLAATITTPPTSLSILPAAFSATPTTSQSPFKSIEKKSPVPTSKILNVPATYGIPPASPTQNIAGAAAATGINSNFGKSPMYVPQSPVHYHGNTTPHPSHHIRPHATGGLSQFPLQVPKTNCSSLVAPATSINPMSSQHLGSSTTISSHVTVQSPMKYQTPPTTYPPPIEAYPSPKINPNFLTPKFDRNTLSRPGNVAGAGSNMFPSPSPVKFDISGSSSGLLKNSSLSAAAANASMGQKTLIGGLSGMSNNIAAAAAASSSAGALGQQPSNDPLKDEIGSILAANLMPSKEESGKIFGIASVSLAQSSGPDNTKCTLGKCGSIHKPVLGPVVPTESYIGDQLSGKERRKAKVNMTHEQIHKWLIECSSNPDEIQDDLDDDFDSELRPNNFSTTPPPTRDDKESTSFSSSSKATRELGKSESAWSAKGPSLKATPVVASTSNAAATNRKEDIKVAEAISPQDEEMEKISPILNVINDKANISNKESPPPPPPPTLPAPPAAAATAAVDEKPTKTEQKLEKKYEKKIKEEKPTANNKTSAAAKETKQNKSLVVDKEVTATTNNQLAAKNKMESPSPIPTAAAAAVTITATTPTTPTTTKQNRKKTLVESSTAASAAPDDKESKINPKESSKISSTETNASQQPTAATNSINRTPKRTPVYQQKQASKNQNANQKETSIKKSANATSSAVNKESIYSFDKDEDYEVPEKSAANKPSTYRRQSKQDAANADNGRATYVAPTTPPRPLHTRPLPKRNAAAVAEIANKELAGGGGNSQSSSVSLTLSPSEKSKLVKVSLDGDKKPATTKSAAGKGGRGRKKEIPVNEPESDSGDGHTFYIPLQGAGTGGAGEGGIQGVAVKLGREGPDGPNQKVIMHATLVTKAQMGSNTKPLPDSMNVSDIVKNLMAGDKSKAASSTAADAAAAATAASTSCKNVPIGTVQPLRKGDTTTAHTGPSTSAAGGGTTGGTTSAGNLQRVNSNSSLFSGSAKSRNAAATSAAAVVSAHIGANKKFKDDTPIKMSNNTAFPRHDDPTQMVEAPIFRPTEKEFADPMEFIERITPIAARFGICKIIPPATFKPECRISDEMRFTAYNQYIHKMLHRWGPSAKELSAIKKYLATQSIVMNHPPWIGGMEVDLPRLYHTVQELGGLKEVIEKKKWSRVAEEMCIPKLAQDRVTKLDDIYCKYLLPYDTLSPAERQKLFDEVEADWAKREARARRNADRFVNTESVSNEDDDESSENDEEESEEEVDGVSMECIVKGRSMPLSQFYRIARNTMALWFKNTEPTVNEVEAEFWRHVAVRDSHVCVHSGSIDSSGWGFGFPSPGPKGKGSNYARHPWNLKVLTNNSGSVLRSLGPVMGVTVPTLHVGMLFSACCWYRDPHGLSWIEYLHTGASKLWYGIPDDQSANFRAALTSLIPTHCQNKTIWLPCDTVMVPPHMLTDRGVSLCRIEQKPGEFIVIFPRAYTSSLATGYVVSESVYFATTSWLDLAKDDFRDIHDSCEPAMFSLEQLLFALGYDQRVTPDAIQQMLPMLQEVYEKETAAREQLKAAGVTSTERVGNEKTVGKGKKQQQAPHKSIESECDLCRANLYISMVRTDESNIYCLQHALKNLNNGNIQAKQCKLIYAYNVDDIENLIKNLKERIQQKQRIQTSKKQK